MYQNMKVVYSVLAILFVAGCTAKKVSEKPAIDPIAYQAEIDSWHQNRLTELKGPKGWLNIAGLYWLKEGINTFGSGEGNGIVFPEGKIPERAGFFMLKQNTVTVEPAKGVEITSKGQPINRFVA